eukprot:CAMPEP_0205815444 /NCGR_PEP_ID=MMETSP0205-20121125/21225_1 /ASSEMBLY_ACC=CAM_ASM_000278 /TAXON_ID=36767 /ORGANISM="Euplotes focardii, Strain TN1" /LENGTH=289 /DNA_ID=CAMNT_0053101783 /DNA_START=209 /DNA_END=1075 /DNA_ORIENTATION=-
MEPGSQKSLFPTRKTEQELMIFKEIFIEPKEKELEKLKERAKEELLQYEMKISAIKPKKNKLKPLTAKRHIDLDLQNLNIDHQSKQQFEQLISDFKKSIAESRRREDAAGDCLLEGKQGLDYFLNGNKSQSLASFQSCITIGKSLKNSRLRLDCLLWIGYTIRILLENEKFDLPNANIPSHLNMGLEAIEHNVSGSHSNSFLFITIDALEGAYNLAKKFNKNKLSQELLCNLGIVKANMTMTNFTDKHLASVMNIESMYGETDDSEEEGIDGEEDEQEKIEEDDDFEDL